MTNRFKARRLPVHPGTAAWNAILAPQAPPTILRETVYADVAIIGAGFAGLSAARRLHQLQSDLNLVVLEACRIAEGPAGRNSGFMIDLPHDLSSDSYAGTGMSKDKAETELNRKAIGFAQTLSDELELSSTVFDRSGKINAAATPEGDQHNREYSAHLLKMGEPFEMLDARQMSEISGISHYISGLYTPGTALLQPAAYIRAIAASVAQTAAIYEQSPVVTMSRHQGKWKLETSEGMVVCEKIILAVNGHVESFGFFRKRLLHVFTYASMTEPLADEVLGGRPSWGVTPADPMGTTVRRIDGEGGNRIIIRSRFTCNPDMTASDQAVQNAGVMHDVKFAQRFPMLKGVKMEYRWGGHLCLSLNSVPAHGEVEEGVFSAACQNGLGVAKGTLSGISAAELLLGHSSDITETMTAMPAPSRLPPKWITWLGANTKLRWKEARAGRE
ncbi:MAG: FAD-binding oxidoreductase [Pseudomonadota bacterium]